MDARLPTTTLTALLVAGGVLAVEQFSLAAPPATTAAPATAASSAPTIPVPVSSPELDAARAAQQLGLQLAVEEHGPERAWLMTIRNTGVEPVLLTADAKLLYFEVEVPGRKKTTLCMLPEAMRKGGPSGLLTLPLEPGEVLTRHFDPRFYCFEEGEQSVLVPGALMKPRYGWPLETKTSWQKGKRVTEVVPPAPPFAAQLLKDSPPPSDAEPEHGSGRVGETMEPPEAPPLAPTAPAPVHGIKLLEANAFALGSQYSLWSSDGVDPEHKQPIRVRVTRGSDSETERGVTVSVGLTNQTNEPLNLFFRRELVSFEVLGPTGNAICKIEEDLREPERQAFLRMAPGREEVFVSRLVEMCPRGTFMQPGFYLVGATLHARYSGERFELHAFVGDVPSMHAKPVRVRKPEEPFLTPAPPAFRSSGAAPAAPAAPVPPPPPPPPAPVEGG